MSDDDIDLNRVVSDPVYRRAVIDWLNFESDSAGDGMERADDWYSGEKRRVSQAD